MVRLAIIFFSAYTWGHQLFADYRPSLIDGPLIELHSIINTLAIDVAKVGPKINRAVQPENIITALENTKF